MTKLAEPEWNPPVIVGDIVDSRIVMGHGAGGKKMHRLIKNVFVKHFGSPALRNLADAAVLPGLQVKTGTVPRSTRTRGTVPVFGELVMTTDSYVVQPIFFPGGDIGKLAVCGTVNDLAVMGAKPRFISLAFVLREGLEVTKLEAICRSIAAECRKAGIQVVTGDTKVIERGEADELYINTTGIGTRLPGAQLGPEQVKPGDVILINGPIGEHEAAIAVARGAYRFKGKAESDCAALDGLVLPLLAKPGVRLMRDPTRGGLATTLNEFAEATGRGFVVDEAALPVSKHVLGVAELLGLSPFYMANEGKVVVVADPKAEARVLGGMRRHRLGRQAAMIGEVVKKPEGVWLRTRIGSLRPLIMLEAEQLPRIC
ncbi:hydrogenase expression/formation protein HypE [candidate division WOR-3 bacterium]|uniref:Hydrogenase expression/formation protein HypE n=1 Tax=candidate division WOR-3 bacterium TaxID=2052148 RepID=A0A938BQV5_UNCW3|nr:hydrogenase expression/formation protein HypE [candidate division WOR-3 bacterium]